MQDGQGVRVANADVPELHLCAEGDSVSYALRAHNRRPCGCGRASVGFRTSGLREVYVPGVGQRGNQWCCCAPNNNDKKILVQSVLLTRGKPGSSPSWISAVASVATSVSGKPLALLPDLMFRDVSTSIHAIMSTYFFYDGSLTAPPCSPAVQWLVVKKAVEVGSDDLAAIASLSVGGNARSVQALNGRTLSVAGTVQL